MKQGAHLSLDNVLPKQQPVDETDMGRMELRELEQEIKAVVAGLPDKCRLIFKMSRDEGLSAKQIAQQLDISHRTVETQISKAVRVIKSALQKFSVLLFL